MQKLIRRILPPPDTKKTLQHAAKLELSAHENIDLRI
jgi:hypothetical protein